VPKRSLGEQPDKELIMVHTIELETPQRQIMVPVTDSVRRLVHESACAGGICLVFCPHTTAGLTINSRLDPATALDMQEELDRLVPTRVDFHHIFDTPSDAAGHIKAMLTGTQLTLFIEGGDLVLGESQGLFFCEFDGPRRRKVLVKIIPLES
jgi:secondary thiamine-phosphate synthase enzyme